MILAVAVALVLQAQDGAVTAPPPSAEPVQVLVTTSATAEPTYSQSGEELVCRTRRNSNSRVGRRVCMTQAASDEEAERAREQMRSMMENSGHNNTRE